MLRIFKNVANIEETIKMLQCCYAFNLLVMLQCFFIKRSLKTSPVLFIMLRVLLSHLRRLVITGTLKNYCKGCRCCSAFKMLQMLQCFQKMRQVLQGFKREMLRVLRGFSNVAETSVKVSQDLREICAVALVRGAGRDNLQSLCH